MILLPKYTSVQEALDDSVEPLAPFLVLVDQQGYVSLLENYESLAHLCNVDPRWSYVANLPSGKKSDAMIETAQSAVDEEIDRQ